MGKMTPFLHFQLLL